MIQADSEYWSIDLYPTNPTLWTYAQLLRVLDDFNPRLLEEPSAIVNILAHTWYVAYERGAKPEGPPVGYWRDDELKEFDQLVTVVSPPTANLGVKT